MLAEELRGHTYDMYVCSLCVCGQTLLINSQCVTRRCLRMIGLLEAKQLQYVHMVRLRMRLKSIISFAFFLFLR
jgi:hypothetical protein